VRKAQEIKFWWKGLNVHRNKFKVPDAKHETRSWEKMWRNKKIKDKNIRNRWR
jgi:hypothetical protein